VLVLSAIGLLGRRREVLWWLVVGVLFLIFAMGPQLQWDGHIVDVKLPYRYLYDYVPGFSITGIPGRFVVMISLATAVLAGYGLLQLIRYLRSKAFVLALVAGLAVLLEFASLPMDGSDTNLPEFYHTMAADSQSYAVIDAKWDANYLMHAQTVHGKPLVGGWLARLPEEKARYLDQGSLERALVYLMLGERAAEMTDAETLRRELQSSLTRHNVRYIIDHDNQIGGWITQGLGWVPIHTESGEEEITVYSTNR
jgi:hypothetical protein